MMSAWSDPMGADPFGFCQPLSDLIRLRTVTGRSGRVFNGLAALSTTNNLLVLRQLMMTLKPERTLEIGLSFGGSCLAFAASHRDLHRLPEKRHIALDPFQDQVWDDCALMLLSTAGLSQYVDFRSAYSALELPRLLQEGERFGLIYVDGSHLFEDVFVDAYYSTRLLENAGVITFDDCANPNVATVIRFLRANCGDSLEEVDLSRYRDDRGASLQYRIGKLVGRVQMIAFRKKGPVERAWDSPFHRF